MPVVKRGSLPRTARRDRALPQTRWCGLSPERRLPPRSDTPSSHDGHRLCLLLDVTRKSYVHGKLLTSAFRPSLTAAATCRDPRTGHDSRRRAELLRVLSRWTRPMTDSSVCKSRARPEHTEQNRPSPTELNARSIPRGKRGKCDRRFPSFYTSWLQHGISGTTQRIRKGQVMHAQTKSNCPVYPATGEKKVFVHGEEVSGMPIPYRPAGSPGPTTRSNTDTTGKRETTSKPKIIVDRVKTVARVCKERNIEKRLVKRRETLWKQVSTADPRTGRRAIKNQN